MMNRGLDWRSAHRIRLHNFANPMTDEPVSFIAPDLPEAPSEGSEGHMLPSQFEEAYEGDLAEFFYNMKLAGSPLQCLEEDGTCRDMR
jgi:beta-1,2-xylosyltransferase